MRKGYRDKAAILALLYRHSLMHTDEMRILGTNGKAVNWGLGFNAPAKHLQIEKMGPDAVRVNLDLTTIYDDLVKLCQANRERVFHGKAAIRYNDWTILTLDSKPSLTRIERRAVKEVAALFASDLPTDQR
jgi:hypothetical protein